LKGEAERRVAELIRSSNYVVVFTGAGISADSGIPTFRGPGGLWEKYKPEELASPWGFRKDPLLVWRWYAWRMRIIYSAKPNAAHILVAKLEDMGKVKAVITQNVDGLHQRAGSKKVIELHGNIWRARCTSCGYKWILSRPPEDSELPLRCPRCNSLARPDVVWFGEPLPSQALRAAWEEMEKANLVIVIGTSGVVEPAGSLPLIAKERGAKLININPEPNRYYDIADVNVMERADPFARKLAKELGIEL
jgi:NAD-dependent deacetylase